MNTHNATRISIIAEKLIQEGIVRVLDEAGASGYSFFDGSGKGKHGSRPAHRPSVVNEFAIVKIEVIVTDPSVAEFIVRKVTDEFFGTYSGIVYMENVRILRPEKF